MIKEERRSTSRRQQDGNNEMGYLQESVHDIDGSISNIKSYFIGLDPQQHIIHHVRLEETAEMANHLKKAIWGSVISIVFTFFVAFIQISNVRAEKEFQQQVLQLAQQKHQVKKDE